MIKKIFSLVAFIFALSLCFSENVETLETPNTEESISKETIQEETSPLGDEKSADIPENDENVETQEEDLYQEDVLLKTIEAIGEKNIVGTPIKKLEKDVFLFMHGFGEAEFKWTIGLEFFKDYTQTIIQSPVLVQEANLSLLLLMKRCWYFGINYRDKVYDSSIYVGYIDIENDIKKHIRLGNKGINFPNIYPFIKGGGSSSRLSPGISAQFEGEKWRFDSIVRYDSGQKNKRIFYGKNEIIENKTSIASWKKAQYFYIPYHNLYEKSFDVYVKDSQHGNWRLLPKYNYEVDSRKNILILNKSYNYGVAINLFSQTEVDSFITETKHYFFGTPIQDLIDNDLYINIHTLPFLVLKKYNSFSCFEIASIYAFDNIDYNQEVYVTEKASGDRSNSFEVKLNYINQYFDSTTETVLGQVHLNYIDIDYKEAITRFPFLKDNEHIYVPSNNKDDKNSYELLNNVYIPVSDFVLPKDASDIEVIKNGIPILDFTYDEYSNIVHIRGGVFPSDKIEIRWTENKKYSSDGMVSLGGAGQYRPFEWLTLFLATMSNLTVKKDKNEINDKYSISTGFDIKYQSIEAGSHFGFEANSNRNDKKAYISKNHFYFNYKDEKRFSIFSSPRVFLDFDVNRSDKISLHSNTELGLDIWKISFDGKISLQDNINNKNVIESVGHIIKMPIYFFYMDEDFFINLNESILSRSNKIKFEKYISFNHLTSVNYDRRFVYQQITSSISPIIPETNVGNFFMEFKVNLYQKYLKRYNLYNNYALVWKDSLIDSYSVGAENPLLRNEALSFIFNWSYPKEMNYDSGFNILGFNFDAKIYATNNLFSQKNENITYSFRVPLAFNEVFITPFWERLSSKEISFRKSLSYKDDFASLFAGLKEQYWFFSTPIIYDIFDRSILNKMRGLKNNYSFSNTYGLDVSRLISNTLKDLYTPHEFNMSLARIIRFNNSSMDVREYYKLKFDIRYTALDIFMSKYSTGIFKNINQDELVRDYDFYFIFSKDYFNFYFNSIHKLYFYQHGDNKIGFENKFDIEVEKIEKKLIAKAWKEDISFLYCFKGYKSLINMLFSLFTKFSLLDEREEKLTVSIFRQTYSSTIDYKFTFRHTQKTKIAENGQIKMFADVSIASTRRSSVLLNLTFGIAGKVEY